jgi:hypothetical protein
MQPKIAHDPRYDPSSKGSTSVPRVSQIQPTVLSVQANLKGGPLNGMPPLANGLQDLPEQKLTESDLDTLEMFGLRKEQFMTMFAKNAVR